MIDVIKNHFRLLQVTDQKAVLDFISHIGGEVHGWEFGIKKGLRLNTLSRLYAENAIREAVWNHRGKLAECYRCILAEINEKI